jgi:two-component system chemotaxis response regulator CheB
VEEDRVRAENVDPVPAELMNYELIVIGASWGGLRAVGEILSALPEDLDAAVVVAQHRQADSFEGGLASLLAIRTQLPVGDVDDKQPIAPGHVYLAPPDYHLLIEHGYFSLSMDERVHFARPSIDVLFASAADSYRDRVIGVILTGANEDGAAGLARIKALGGVAVVQDPVSAERPEMPGAALAVTAADAVLPLEEIGPFLYGLVVKPKVRS